MLCQFASHLAWLVARSAKPPLLGRPRLAKLGHRHGSRQPYSADMLLVAHRHAVPSLVSISWTSCQIRKTARALPGLEPANLLKLAQARTLGLLLKNRRADHAAPCKKRRRYERLAATSQLSLWYDWSGAAFLMTPGRPGYHRCGKAHQTTRLSGSGSLKETFARDSPLGAVRLYLRRVHKHTHPHPSSR